MDCDAKLGEGFQGAEHEVTLRKNYSRIPMVLPDFLEASTQILFVRDLHLELPRIALGHYPGSFGKFLCISSTMSIDANNYRSNHSATLFARTHFLGNSVMLIAGDTIAFHFVHVHARDLNQSLHRASTCLLSQL